MVPLHKDASATYVKSALLIRIVYPMIGEPFSIGLVQLKMTLLPLSVVTGTTGVDGAEAHKIWIT